MGHHDLWVWTDLETLAAKASRKIKSSLIDVHEQHEGWVVFKDSRSDSTIASDEGWVEADITLVRLALEKAEEVYQFANNAASPTQADRMTAMRDLAFSFGSNPMVKRIRPQMQSLLLALVNGDESFSEFKAFQGADTDAQSATQLNTGDPGNTATAALVGDAKVALRSANQCFGYANNEASPVQRDRLKDWRILT